MVGELSFIELGVEDAERGRAFYEALFGWRFDSQSEGGATIEGAGRGGGIHPGDAGASPYVFFDVPDLDQAMDRVRELGGEGDVLPTSDPGQYGRFALCKDDQGSSFGLREPPGGGQDTTR